MTTFRFSRIQLRNWRNFSNVDVPLARRVFLVGPNASGKSNFLDAFRFLRDLVIDGGGLAKAVQARDGISKLRSLFARTITDIEIYVDVANEHVGWRYELAFTSDPNKDQRPFVTHERVIRREGATEIPLFTRPDEDDRRDPKRRGQTFIQQVTRNEEFRDLAEFFTEISYLHLVPHLVREGQPSLPSAVGPDPFGRDFLDNIRATGKATRVARLKRIQDVLEIVAAPLSNLELVTDGSGRPHLQVRFKHWRPRGAYQSEQQLSDGTLRLIGLLWSLQEKAGPLLLEEPELSLHSALVRKLAPFIHRAQRAGNGRQVILSTHSVDLLMDPGIAAEEVLVVRPTNEGSVVEDGPAIRDVSKLMSAGVPASEAVLPLTRAEQLSLFDSTSL